MTPTGKLRGLMNRWSCLIPLVVFMHAGCATTPANDIAEEEAVPFVKLATRGMALIVNWTGTPPGPTVQGELEDELTGLLSKSYATEVEAHRGSGAFSGIDGPTLARMVEKEVDDVVVLEVGSSATGFSGTLRVLTLEDEKAVFTTKIGTPNADAKVLAKTSWLKILREFSDPGRFPELDDLNAANRLADRNYCDLAVSLYRRALEKSKTSNITEAARVHAAREKLSKCEREIALRQAIENDAKATFRLSLEFDSVAARVQDAFRKALPSAGFEEHLRKLTDKPVVVRVQPGLLRVEMRYHPDRYAEAIVGRERYVRGQPLIYFDIYERIMIAALALKAAAATELPPYDQQAIKQLRTTFRLSTLIGDFIELEFGETRTQVAIGDALRVHSVGRGETVVKASAPKELRDMIFTLGPPEMLDGKLTEYGLVLKFLDVRP